MAVAEELWMIKQAPEMDEEQFHLWQALLEERTGMQLSSQRKRFLETSLHFRMREIGCQHYDEYYEQLLSGPAGQVEWAILVDRITVQETRFFRHLSSFNLVRDYCSDKLRAIPLTPSRDCSLEIWSVGCATGEEPYSLAMLLDHEIVPKWPQLRWGITATDISLPALAKAREAIYSERKLDHVEPRMREKYFRRLDSGNYQLDHAIKERVCFARINVLDLDAVPFRDLDLIFCQNLLIYFRRWRKRDIVNALASRLKMGGVLILGLGEVLDWSHPALRRVPYENTLAYTRCE